MTLNYVTLTLDLYDGQGNPEISGKAVFTPSAVLTDAGVEIAGQQPITAVFRAGGLPAVRLLATDSSGPLPAGWTWSVEFSGISGAPAGFSFFLPFTGGASQLLSNLIPVSSGTAFQAYAPALTRVAVQTANYAASGNQLVPVDTTSGSVTVALPSAPAAGTMLAVKQVTLGTGHAVTVACSGSDVLNKAGGGTTGTLTLLAQGMLLHYSGSGIWTVLADDLPLSQLDARYQLAAAGWRNIVTAYGAKGDGIALADGAITSGLAVLTSASATFTSADTGKLVTVTGAGAAGAPLATTISGFTDAHTVTLAATAGATVTGAAVVYGTSNDTAFAAAAAALPQPSQGVSIPAVTGGAFYIPAGTYLISSTLNWKLNGLKVVTDGADAVKIVMTASNTPVVQVAGTFQDISGITFSYAAQQVSAQTSAIAMEFGDDTVGSCFASRYASLVIQLAQTGMAVNPAVTSTAGLFSCTFTDIQVNAFSASGINFNGNNGLGGANCTGCVFSNIYISNVLPAGQQACSSFPFQLKNWSEVVINELNIEHCTLSATDALSLSSVLNATLSSVHFEALTLGVNGQALIHLNGIGAAAFSSVSIFGNTYTGSGSNPVVNLFGTGPYTLTVSGFNEKSSTVTTPAHPFINYGSATNSTVSVFGVSATQTTANATTANSGCVSQFGWPLGLAAGGTGQATAAAAYNALSPMTTLGDLEYESGAATAARLAGNTTATRKFLRQVGNGAVSAAPAWDTLAAGDLPAVAGFTSFATGGAANLINSSSGGNTAMTAGTWYYAALWVPFAITVTGLIATTGNIGGTDNWIVALWAAAGGTTLANSSLSGIAAPAANTKKAFAFTGTVPLPAGVYYAGVQSNGTTAKFLSFANAIEGFFTGNTAGSFGTVISLTPPSSYAANAGPFLSTY